jgi:hypothetical protein
MKVFITRYALTNGIMEVDGEVTSQFPFIVTYKTGAWMSQYAHGEGKEWHRTKEGAIARADAMRLARIKSLKKSITKLEAMTFNA